MKYEQTIILYISLDGGYSYRQNRWCEETFKKKLWENACKWLRPDSDMSLERYGVDVIVRNASLGLVGIIRVSGERKLENIWTDICELWDKIKKES